MDGLEIIADENIPFVEEAFGRLGRVHTMAGRDIDRAAIRGGDALLVRSVTPVGPGLLDGQQVQFVGSATVGTDHVDEAYLEEQEIRFAHAPGSNADSVADYVLVALLYVARSRGVALSDRTVGVVGCGNIGSRVTRRLRALGVSVLENDPPRADDAEAAGRDHSFVDLDTVLAESDVVTVHVPLTHDGPYPTHHLVDRRFLTRLGPEAWLVNTSRGSVVDAGALHTVLDEGRLGALVLDVWEDEPSPDPYLIRSADVATPHIAGYATDGKVRGTEMLYRAMSSWLDCEPAWQYSQAIRPLSKEELSCTPPDPRLPPTDWLYRLASQAYALDRDDAAMREIAGLKTAERGAAFSRLRSDYPRRRELQQQWVEKGAVPERYRQAVRNGLTIEVR